MENLNLLTLLPSLNVTHPGQVGASNVQTGPAQALQGTTGTQKVAEAALSGVGGEEQELDLKIPTFPSKTESDRQLISVDVPI